MVKKNFGALTKTHLSRDNTVVRIILDVSFNEYNLKYHFRFPDFTQTHYNLRDILDQRTTWNSDVWEKSGVSSGTVFLSTNFSSITIQLADFAIFIFVEL